MLSEALIEFIYLALFRTQATMLTCWVVQLILLTLLVGCGRKNWEAQGKNHSHQKMVPMLALGDTEIVNSVADIFRG